MSSSGVYAIGVDVGGTFTDVVAGDGEVLWRAKAPTDPLNFANGVIAACELLSAQIGTDLSGLMARASRLGVGTTAVTNAVISRQCVKAGLVTTAGFEELLPMAKGG